MSEFKDKITLITGGSLGIGFATASLLAKNGAKVIIVGRHESALIEAKNKIANLNVEIFQADISSLSDLDALYEHIKMKYGKIDVLFANAGCAERVWIGDASEETFDKIVNVNYKGTYFTIQKAIPYLKEGASIILNASIAGNIALERHTIYSSTKAAIIQLAKTLAADLARKKIRVNSISPGYIKTPIWDQWFEEEPKKYKALCKTVPFEQRFGSPDEIAKVVLFLASSSASYITAQNVIVDGGLTTIIPSFKEC